MHQLIDQPKRADDKTFSVLDVMLTSHPTLHHKRAVLKYTHIPSVADHNTVKFRDMKIFDMESFSSDLISCDILNCSLDDADISGETWKLSYTDICDKHAPMKSLRQKERLCMSATMYTLRLHKAMIQDYGKITVIYGIK